MDDWLELLNDRIRLGADIHLEPISGSFRRQSGNTRRWFQVRKADIRLGRLDARADDCVAAIVDTQGHIPLAALGDSVFAPQS